MLSEISKGEWFFHRKNKQVYSERVEIMSMLKEKRKM